MTQCAHARVVYVKQHHPGGICSDRWECDSCRTEFRPFLMDRERVARAAALIEKLMPVAPPGDREWLTILRDFIAEQVAFADERKP